MHPYENAFAHDNVYGHAMSLLGRFSLKTGGIHLDFGCGFGAMAEEVRDRLGLRYIGLDILEDGLNSLKARGFDTLFFDLFDPQAGLEILKRWLPPEVPVVSISLLDTLEHLAEPEKAMQLLHAISSTYACPFVLSVPNVSHRDIGLKSVVGRFDYTESGLLDRTHFQYFTERSLSDRMAEMGWHEVYRNDVLMEKSDQNFPVDQPMISAGTPIYSLLSHLRSQVDANDSTNQFVRVYLPGVPLKAAAKETNVPFITVVTRTQGRRLDTLREALLCLSAQTCQDFEVLVVGHRLTLDQQLGVERIIADTHQSIQDRVRLVKVDKGERAAPLNAAFEAARGRYVVMLDDDDLVFGHWIETFAKLHEDHPGKLLRSVAVSQSWDKVMKPDGVVASRCKSGYRTDYATHFDLLDHLIENRTPLHSVAFPASLYKDLGFRFDESLTTAEDWDFIVRVAPIAGVACSEEITCIYRRWENAPTSSTAHSQDEWHSNYQHTLRKVDALPLLLPAGTTRRIRELLHQVDSIRERANRYHLSPADLATDVVHDDYKEALRWRAHDLLSSKSWRYTAVLRGLKRLIMRQPPPSEIRIWRLNVKDLEYLIGSIENSTSWKQTAFLRAFLAASRS